MARLLENTSKRLLRENGLPVPECRVARSPSEAAGHAADLGLPVVLKALVPVGKRGKAGAVKFASTEAEASRLAAELLSMTVGHFPVTSVLVERKLDVERELYVAVTIDRGMKQPVVVFSAEGGVEIEEINRRRPEQVVRHYVDDLRGLALYEAKEICYRAGLSGTLLRDVAPLVHRLYETFVQHDCELLEINPLVVTNTGQLAVAAALMTIDSAALYRQSALQGGDELYSERFWRPETALEKAAIEVNEAEPYRGTARYTEMPDGDIGFMCGGGGGSLLMYDALLHYGGRPANYSEFGGNPTETKVKGLAKVILSKPGLRGLLVAGNITNNTQVDVVARGIVAALAEAGIDPRTFPVLVRYAGVNDDAGRAVFEAAGVEYHGEDISLSAAARLMVERLGGRRAEETDGHSN